VYDEVIYALNKIMAEAEVLAESPAKASNETIVAIGSVMYVYDKMLKELVDLG